MSQLLTESLWSMQPEATATGTAQPSGEPAAGGPPPGCAGGSEQMILLAVMFGVFYFLLIRPQQKRQREMDDLLKSLKKGDKVRTSGGIRGEIADITESEVTLIIADKVKINILRSHVASRIDRPAAEGTGGDDKSKTTAG